MGKYTTSIMDFKQKLDGVGLEENSSFILKMNDTLLHLVMISKHGDIITSPNDSVYVLPVKVTGKKEIIFNVFIGNEMTRNRI